MKSRKSEGDTLAKEDHGHGAIYNFVMTLVEYLEEKEKKRFDWRLKKSDMDGGKQSLCL